MKTLKISKLFYFVIIFLALFLIIGPVESRCEEFFPVADTSLSWIALPYRLSASSQTLKVVLTAQRPSTRVEFPG